MTSPLLHLIFFISGFAALGLQLMWTRIFSVGIGHELGSVLAVISAFFGGITLGAWYLDKPIRHTQRPGMWYAALEGMIAFWGVISVLAIPFANRMIFRTTSLDSSDLSRWAICFLIPFLTLLPATFCMGGTLPAMERAVNALTNRHKPISGLYAANTLGAGFGVFTAAFVMSSNVGYRKSLLIFAFLALICSLATLIISWGHVSPNKTETTLNPLRLDPISVALFFTGLLGIGYEIVVTRALSQFFEDSVYTYSLLLIVYLFGTSLGAAIYKRNIQQTDSNKILSRVLAGLTLTCLTGIALLSFVYPIDFALWSLFGRGHVGHFAGEMAGASLLFFLPTLFMGATFSHLAQTAKEKSFGLGYALAVNTLGGALAPFLFGILILPTVGIRGTLVSISLGYCAFIRPFKHLAFTLTAAIVPLIAVFLLPWNLVTLPSGSHLLEYHEGAMSSVAVIENEDGSRQLKVDNLLNMGGTQSLSTERLKTHIPLLLHPNPEKALFIGIGTGITFGTATDYKTLQAVGVELDPLVVEMLPNFAPYNHSPYNGETRIYAADARRYVRSTTQSYDMVLADFFHPYRDGAATLYTREHFQAIHARLKTGGIFCQWLPLYQLDMNSLRIIIRTFLDVFPNAQGFLGNFSANTPGLALIGSQEKRVYTADWFEKRTSDVMVREMLDKEAISDGFRVQSFFIASHHDLETIAGSGPLNTDDCPRVMYINPGFSRLKEFTPYGRLDSLLSLCKHEPADWLGNATDSTSRAYRDDLAKVLTARDLYLHGAIADAKGNTDEALRLYLLSAEVTGLFTVGYAQCLTMAIERHEENSEWSKGMLHKLVEVRPEIEDARAVLREMFNE
jgi:spermidine synthase